MICRNCGAVLPDNSKFCTVCGAKQDFEVKSVEKNDNNNNNNYLINDVTSSISESNFFSLLKRLKKRQIIIYSLSIIGIVLLLFLAIDYFFGPKRISVDELMGYEISGYNKNGKISFFMNYDYSIFKEYDEVNEEFNRGCVYADENLRCNQLYQKLNLLEEAIDSIDYSTNSKRKELQNGDTIHLAISADDKLLSAAGYKISKRGMDITIDGLPEIRKVDLFDGVTFVWEFNQNENEYQVVANVNSKDLEKVEYYVDTIDKKGNAKVTVQNQNSLAQEYGILPKDSVLEKEIHIGLKPLHIIRPNENNEKAIREFFEQRMENLISSCNSVLVCYSEMGGYEIYDVNSYEFKKMSESDYGVDISYTLNTKQGDVDLVMSFYNIYLLENGDYVDNGNYRYLDCDVYR